MKYRMLYFAVVFSIRCVTAQNDTLITNRHSGVITGTVQTNASPNSILAAHHKRLTEQANWFDSANKALNSMPYINDIPEAQKHTKEINLVIRCSLIGAIVAASVLLYERRKRKVQKGNT